MSAKTASNNIFSSNIASKSQRWKASWIVKRAINNNPITCSSMGANYLDARHQLFGKRFARARGGVVPAYRDAPHIHARYLRYLPPAHHAGSRCGGSMGLLLLALE